MRFQFIDAKKAHYSVASLCRMLSVSKSGFYAWKRRPPSRRAQEDERIRLELRVAHRRSRETYGAPRLHRDLREAGFRIGRKRVSRLMKDDGLQGRSGRKKVRTTRRNPIADAPDLVQRNFTAPAPNRVWCVDTTYVHCGPGFVFLVVFVDLFSRRVVGWAIGPRLGAELANQAFARAVAVRQPQRGLIVHSDRGSEFTAESFTGALSRIEARQSLGRTGHCLDNAVSESFFGTLKGDLEITDGLVFDSLAEAERHIGDYLDNFYNRQRRHSTIGYASPVDFERSLRPAQMSWAA